MILANVVVERVIYKAQDDGYIIVACSTDEQIPPECLGRPSYMFQQRNPFVAAFYDMANLINIIDKKRRYKMEGKWVNTKYGWQFSAENIARIIGTSQEDVINYLSELKGVGPKTAQRIYDKFGSESITVVKKNPERLSEVKGIKGKRLDGIIEFLKTNEAYNDVINFLFSFSLSQRKMKLIYERYGRDAIETAKKNPFDLCNIPGIDFPDANIISLTLNIGVHSKQRIYQGILYAINRIMAGKGDLYISEQDIINRSYNVLNYGLPASCSPIPDSEIKAGIDTLVASSLLKLVESKNKDRFYYKIDYYLCEKYTADRLVDFLYYPERKKIPIDKLEQDIREAENEIGFNLSKKQSEAVKTAINSGISIITGGPGTGKSTILSVLIKVFEKNFSKNIALCAPTGRAARRMAETTGRQDASTIHSLLGIKENYEITYESETSFMINPDLIIIDESSMIDMKLMYMLMSAIPYKSRVVFVGDADQLPSVSPGNVLREMIHSGLIPTCYLDINYRQAGLSRITKNSDKIIKRNSEFEYGEDFVFYESSDIEDIKNEIVKSYFSELKKHMWDMDKVQILTPYKSFKMPCSTGVLNEIIQEGINPKMMGKREMKVGKTVFRVNDRVIQQLNTDDAKNGDIGKVSSIYVNQNGDTIMRVAYPDNREVEYTRSDVEEFGIALAYAITAHKSQGSEFDTILMPILPEHNLMLNKNIIYTSITRACSKVMLFGNKSTFISKCKVCSAENRKSLLAERMKARNARYLNKYKFKKSTEQQTQLTLSTNPV